MLFKDFEESVLAVAAKLDNKSLKIEYTACKDNTYNELIASGKEAEAVEVFYKECRFESLRSMKEQHLYTQLFYLLEHCESADMLSLIDILFEEERSSGTLTLSPLLLIMKCVSKEEKEKLAEHYFVTSAGNSDKCSALGDAVARCIYACRDNFGINELYVEVVKTIYDVVKLPEFFNALEHRLKVLEKVVGTSTGAWEIKKAYFYFLCEQRAYRAANSFLDRIWKTDSLRKLFRLDNDEVKTMLYCYPSPELLAWGKKYIQNRDASYTHEEWLKDINTVRASVAVGNSDDWKSVDEWLNVSQHINALKVDPESDEALGNLAQIPMFDVKKHSYMTEMCCQMAEIIQDWMGVEKPQERSLESEVDTVESDDMAADAEGICATAETKRRLSDEQLIGKLTALKDKNLFSYEAYAGHISAYRGYSNLKKILNVDGMTKRLSEVNDLEQFVYVFFHTPLWLFRDFYEFVSELKTKADDRATIEFLLGNYTFVGKVDTENKESAKSAVSQERFKLVPIELCWTFKWKSAKNGKSEKVYGNYLYIESNWLKENVGKIEDELKITPVKNDDGKIIYPPSFCTFKVSGFSTEPGKTNRLQIKEVVPNNVTVWEEEDEARVLFDRKRIFLNDLDTWFKSICNDNKFHRWNDRTDEEGMPVIVLDPLKVYPEREKGGKKRQIMVKKRDRIKIASSFLKVVESLALSDCEELATFLRQCSFRPLENINEFRYIAEQHWTNFGLTDAISEENFSENFSEDLLEECSEEISEAEERIVRQRWEKKAEELMTSEVIPAALKLEIYMNTCIRKVYSLETLLEKNPEIGKLLFEDGTEWIVPVKFEDHGYVGDKGYKTRFSMKSVMRDEKIDIKKQYVIKSDYTFYHNKNIQIPQEALNGIKKPNGVFVMFATMRSMDTKYKAIELNEYFFSTDMLNQNFPWREYKKCFYDLKKLVRPEGLNNMRYAKLLDEEMLVIYNRLKTIKFSMEKEHRHDTLDKYRQIISEMDEVFRHVDFDVRLCREIVMMLGEKNAFKDMTAFEKLEATKKRTFIENCQNWYGNGVYDEDNSKKKDSYLEFMAAIDSRYAIEDICAVFYLSHLHLLVSDSVFISDVEQKKLFTDAGAKIVEYKEKYLEEDIRSEQISWEKYAKKMEEEERKKHDKKQNDNPRHYQNGSQYNNYNKKEN